MIICPICETENEDGLLECILCGGELPQVEIAEPEPEPPAPPAHIPTQPPPPVVQAQAQDHASTGVIPSLSASAPPAAPTPPESTPGPANPIPNEPPPPGTLCLIVYFKRRPALYFPVIYDEILIGRTDPASNSYPDLDVTPYDPELAISRKHAYLYREGENAYIYPISNSGTQVNQEMVDIGAKKKLNEGDVVILSGRLAIRYARIPANRQS